MKGRLQAYSCKLDWGRHAEGVGELPDEPSDDDSDGVNDDDDDDGDNGLHFPDCNRLPNDDALSDENENVVQQPVNVFDSVAEESDVVTNESDREKSADESDGEV